MGNCNKNDSQSEATIRRLTLNTTAMRDCVRHLVSLEVVSTRVAPSHNWSPIFRGETRDQPLGIRKLDRASHRRCHHRTAYRTHGVPKWVNNFSWHPKIDYNLDMRQGELGTLIAFLDA